MLVALESTHSAFPVPSESSKTFKMKIIILAFAVLLTVNMTSASINSTRANIEATKIRSDYEKRVKAAIDRAYPEYVKIVDKAEANYRLTRKALNEQCKALGSAGETLGDVFEKAIKVYEYAIPDLVVNLSLLKTNAPLIRDAFKVRIFAPATANITALVSAISKYPKASPCWDDNKERTESTAASYASMFESVVEYLLTDTAENISPANGNIYLLGYYVSNYAVDAQKSCASDKVCKLAYVSLGVQNIELNLFSLFFFSSSVHQQLRFNRCQIFGIPRSHSLLLELQCPKYPELHEWGFGSVS